MVFPSIPVYLDPPNWQQQQPHQFIGGGNGQEQTLDQLSPLPPPPPPTGGPARPGSMADRARMAKVAQPEAALKCPRCESTNTKFCYYNNYSLSQPRHFCKTCRRYWTRGGALRNVPVGGGCRRNKRSKGRGGSKSPAMVVVSGGATTTAGVGALPSPPVPPPTQLPFLPPLQSLSDYGDVDFQNNGSGGGGGVGQIGSSGLLIGEQWRVHQFPFLTNLATTPAGGLFHFEGEGMNNGSQLGLNFPRNLLGISGNYDQSSWSHDVPGFTSSTSTTHHL